MRPKRPTPSIAIRRLPPPFQACVRKMELLPSGKSYRGREARIGEPEMQQISNFHRLRKALPSPLLAAFFALLVAACATGPAPSGAEAPMRAQAATLAQVALKPDSSIDSGSLKSGLHYAFVENKDPKDRLSLRLVVKVGSLEEGDDERGVAHFVEHMAFKGTKSFPKDGLVQYMQSIGMRFGADVNAQTTYDSTTYELEVPSRDPKAVATAFAILRDWSDAVLFQAADVESERKVILEEERRGRGADDRVWKKHLPAIYGDSLYARRDPIGTVESIKALTVDQIRAFYAKWYRPELMEVVAVGDLPVSDMEKSLHLSFDVLPSFDGRAALQGPELPIVSVPARPGLRSSIATDPELTNSLIELTAREPLVLAKNEAQFIANAKESIILDLLDERMAEVLRRSGGKGLSDISFDYPDLGSDYRLVTASATFKGGDWLDAANTLRDELARIATYGFGKDEIETMRKDYLASFDEWKKNGLHSSEWVSRLDQAFVKGSVPVSIDDRIGLYKIAFQNLGAGDISRYVGHFSDAPERLVLLSLPDSAGAPPTTKELEAAIAAPTKDLGPWKAASPPSAVMSSAPARVAPLSATDNPQSGVTELVYPNGIRVLLKKTSFKPDNIAFSAIALRGLNSLSLEDCANAEASPALIPASGFAGLSADALKAVLAGKNASLKAGIGQDDCRLSGGADRAGLQTLFQLIHRTMTDPLVDPGYFKLIRDRLHDQAATFANSPENLFSLQIGSALFGDNPKVALFSKVDDIGLLDPARIKTQFMAFFGATKGFTFAFSGSFDAAVMRDYCDRYLGSLPTGEGLSVSVQPLVLAPGASNGSVKAGSENKAEVVMIYKTPESATDLTTIHGLDVLSEALKRRLRDELRIAAGGSYDPSVEALTDEDGRYSTIQVYFGTSPKRADELVRLAEAQVDRIRSEALSQKDIDQIILAFKRELEVSRNTDSYWARELAYASAHGRGFDVPGDELAALAAVTPEWLKMAAQRYLDPSQLAKFELLPKGSP